VRLRWISGRNLNNDSKLSKRRLTLRFSDWGLESLAYAKSRTPATEGRIHAHIEISWGIWLQSNEPATLTEREARLGGAEVDYLVVDRVATLFVVEGGAHCVPNKNLILLLVLAIMHNSTI
jgi:hypothetical protein